MASLTATLLAPLSLQHHLDISNSSAEDLEGELQPLMMAQAVPNPPNDKKRVKVYELKNNDWHDRGTGFCTAAFIFVSSSICDTSCMLADSNRTE